MNLTHPMLPFEVSNLRMLSARATKITSQYAYLLEPDDSVAQLCKGSITHLGREVYRLPIHEQLSRRFVSVCGVSESLTAIPVHVLVYAGEVVALMPAFEEEGMRIFSRLSSHRSANAGIRGNDSAEEAEEQAESTDEEGAPIYRSLVEAIHARLLSVASEARDIGRKLYVSGREVFWLDESEEWLVEMALTKDRSFLLRRVLSIPFMPESLGFAAIRAMVQSGGVRAPRIQDGLVLAFSLDAGATHAAYTPVLRRAEGLGGSDGDNRILDSFYALTASDSRYVPSLELVVKAGRVVGSLYGHEAVEFLDLPRVISQVGTAHLTNIPADQRRELPVTHLHSVEVLAWLMSFFVRETSVSRLARLSSMVRDVIQHGFIDSRKYSLATFVREECKGLPVPIVTRENKAA